LTVRWTTVISDDGMGTDLGYPSSAQLDDGTIVTVWYELLRDSPNVALRLARRTVPGS
jgi:hypothetical protein